VGQARGGGAGRPRGGRAGVVCLLGPAGGALDAASQIAREHQAGDRQEEVGGRPDLQEEVQDAGKPEAGRHGGWEHQEARLKVLPAEDGALPNGQYLHWAKARPTAQCWWCRCPTQTRDQFSRSVRGGRSSRGPCGGRYTRRQGEGSGSGRRTSSSPIRGAVRRYWTSSQRRTWEE